MKNDISNIAGNLIKKIRQNQISETDAFNEIKSIENEYVSSLKDLNQSVSVKTLLNLHSSENFSFFSGIYDFKKSSLIEYSGDNFLAEKILSSKDKLRAAGKNSIDGINSPLYVSHEYKSCSLCSLSSSDYFEEKAFNKFAEFVIEVYHFEKNDKSDISGTFAAVLKEFSSFTSSNLGYCEIFKISNLNNTFSHTGFHNIMKVSTLLKEYFINNDEESRLFALAPDFYLVIRNNQQKLIENPHFELQNIPLKIDKRIIEIKGKEQYADLLRHISG
ncbi:MAG: hypothetical protein KA015_00395 [Spirochaetes bacterium]|nr:hypothetical protein [Spirochaetota bacterium]